MEEFNVCIDACGFVELAHKGNALFWCNGQEGNARQWARLDRALANSLFSESFSSANLEYLIRKSLDHSPMVVKLSRFSSRDVWERPVYGLGLVKLAAKLKRTKVALRAWNASVFGRVDQNIKLLEERLVCLESQLQLNYSEDIESEYLISKLELEVWEKREEARLTQIAKKNWLMEGDKNSKFFHVMVSQRRRSSSVAQMVLENGMVLSSPGVVHAGVVEYFREFLSEVIEMQRTDLHGLMHLEVSLIENEELCSSPMEEEVRAAVFSIPEQSSPGPDDPHSFEKFRPISLCSMAYKIFSKIIVSRLTSVFPRLISPEQGAFIPGRSIFENISLAQEMVHGLKKKTRGGNVMVKIDMVKAYDRLSLKFESGGIGKFYHPMGSSPLVSHLLYADDVLVFLNGTKRSMQRLMKTFALYEKWSKQQISIAKSALFIAPYVSSVRRRRLLRSTGFLEDHFPVTYLGAPLMDGRLKASYLDSLVTKLRAKVAGWKARLLSQGGRLVMLKHVLTSMASHILVVMDVSKVVIAKLNNILLSFFWGEHGGKAKMKWCAWDQISKPTSEGALGLRSFSEVQSVMHMKLAWSLLSTNSLWARFMLQKYGKGRHLSLVVSTHASSRLWRSIVCILPEVCEASKVKANEGRSSFWFDRWVGERSLCELVSSVDQPLLKISDVWLQNQWDFKVLSQLVGKELANEVQRKLVAWQKPAAGWWKLNMDGSCRGNQEYFGVGTNTEVEIRALLYGVKMCKQLGGSHIVLECDLKVVVDWLSAGRWLCKTFSDSTPADIRSNSESDGVEKFRVQIQSYSENFGLSRSGVRVDVSSGSEL
ncbi:uncharacterized protein LOC121257846 [Juglans microcarpa x Juglans regia]|uniref:uncharacterized protein LOC121257846 n=1 Tax=Juglans microcarpa x Juglans regia TaxID=2249226 RepID=UPI001B7E4D8D|nr:uncharacterized protein LOC121257846 [Juglans microcarpa x Juglans regia]